MENINKIKFYGKLMGILDSNPSEWLNKTQKKLTKSEIQEIENLILPTPYGKFPQCHWI